MTDAPQTTPGAELRRIRSLIADLDAVVWEADARSMSHTFVSEAAADILGYTPTEWLEDPTFWADHLHPDDRRRAVGEFVAAATRGDRFDMEYRFIAADGSVVWLRDLGHVVKDMDGNPTLVRGVMVEITAQKQTEIEREEAEGRFRRVVERLPAIVYIENAGNPSEPGALLYVSPQVETILGFSPNEWLSDPLAWARQFHPDDRAMVREEYERVERTGEPFAAEYRMFSRDGNEVRLRDEAVLVRDGEGRPLFWQGIMFDITEQRATESLAARSETRYRSLVEQLPAIVYSEPVTPSDLRPMYISARVQDLLGISPSDWIANPEVWMQRMHPEDRDRVAGEKRRSDETGEPFSTEYRMLAADGRVMWFRDEALLVNDEADEALFWHGVMIDITALKDVERLAVDLAAERQTAQRLREVDEVKNTFLQAVSHDLRTPLAAILGLALTLSREDLEIDQADTRDIATRIAQNARKLDRIVNDLLDLDRLSQGIVEPVLRLTDLGELVRAIIGGSELVAERRVSVTTDPVTVPVDAAKVERIVENLLANAGRHTPAHTQVWVRVERVADGALIIVEDDGPGIPEQVRGSIFEPFSQVAPSERSLGVGVGLALVARFAELHGGRAWIEERKGGGASFRVFLPSLPVVALANDPRDITDDEDQTPER